MKKQVKKVYRFLFLFILLLISSGIISLVLYQPEYKHQCEKDCIHIEEGEPIRLGVIQDLTGPSYIFGIEQIQGIKLALEVRNKRLLDHPLELQIEDEQCSAEGGINAALKIVSMKEIAAIIGTTCSGAAATASKIMSSAGFVMVSGSNISPSLTAVEGKKGADWHPGYFRTIYNGAIIAKSAAIFAREDLGLVRAATINDGSSYAMDISDIFEQIFREAGGEITLSGSVNKGDTDMHPILAAVGNSNAEVIFFPVYRPEGDLIVSHSKDMSGLEDVILMTTGTLLLESFIKSIGDEGRGIYFVSSTPPNNPYNDRFISAYESRYGYSPSTVNISYVYDAVNMVLNAIEKVSIEKNGILHISRNELRKALYQTSDFQGLTGVVSCNKFGDCGMAHVNIMRLDDPGAGLEGLKANVIKESMSYP